MEKTVAKEESGGLPEFRPGMRVEVFTTNNRLIFVGSIQQVERDALRIVEATGDTLPDIEYNSTVKLRGSFQGNTFVVVGMIGGSSRTLWKIDRLQGLQMKDQRQFFRQNASVDAEMMCVNGIFGQQGGSSRGTPQSVPCRIQDISAGGACVRCKEPFAEGDWLFIMGVRLLPDQPDFSFTCRIVRVKRDKSVYEYGCIFCDLDTKEQERLIRSILALQRKELQNRRNRTRL